jgi:hypothetical protein
MSQCKRAAFRSATCLLPLLAIAFYIYALFYWVDRTPDRDRLMTLAGLFVTLIILALSFELLRSG